MTEGRRSVRAVRDRSGGGEVVRVLVGDVAVWTWAAHVDGPLSDDAQALFSALERSTGPQPSARPAGGVRHFRCGHDHDDGEPCPGAVEARERWCAMCLQSILSHLGAPCAAAPSGLHYWSLRERPQAASEPGDRDPLRRRTAPTAAADDR